MLGAAGAVTGSQYPVSAATRQILVDYMGIDVEWSSTRQML